MSEAADLLANHMLSIQYLINIEAIVVEARALRLREVLYKSVLGSKDDVTVFSGINNTTAVMIIRDLPNGTMDPLKVNIIHSTPVTG